MLVDYNNEKLNEEMRTILSMISKGKNIGLERIDTGMYLTNHWSIEHVVEVKNKYRTNSGYEELGEDVPEYGVCDSPEQCVELLKLREHPVEMFVTFVRLLKEDQPKTGGWRWHKWGEYIGTQNPQMEYLADEPEIAEVYTFHIYQPK